MRCSKAQRYIDLQLDGELKPHLQQHLQQHLAGCNACRDWQAEASRMQLMLAQNPAPELPSWVHPRIMDQIHRLDNARPSFVRRFKLATATAAIAIMLSTWAGMEVGIKSFNSTYTSETSTTTSSTYSGFGENTMLDSYVVMGDSNE